MVVEETVVTHTSTSAHGSGNPHAAVVQRRVVVQEVHADCSESHRPGRKPTSGAGRSVQYSNCGRESQTSALAKGS